MENPKTCIPIYDLRRPDGADEIFANSSIRVSVNAVVYREIEHAPKRVRSAVDRVLSVLVRSPIPEGVMDFGEIDDCFAIRVDDWYFLYLIREGKSDRDNRPPNCDVVVFGAVNRLISTVH